MTTAFALVALLAFVSLNAGGAAGAACECPRVVVQCPEQAVSGQPFTYTASVEGFAGDVKPTYQWTTSAGVITSETDASSIVVDTTGLYNERVEATVEVGGLPEGCPNTASCATSIPLGCGYIRSYDEYGDIGWGDEKARLDNFAVEMQNTPGWRGYLFAYGGRVGRAGEAQVRAGRARDYLVKTRGVDSSRVFVIDGGYREELTIKFYLLPPDAPPPEPNPSVDPTEVKFIKEPSPPRRSTTRRARRANR